VIRARRRRFIIYDALFSDDFRKECAYMRKKDRENHDRIRKAVLAIREEPYHNSAPLTAGLLGKRKKYAGKMRIIYAVCEECRRLDHVSLNGCVGCDAIPDLNVIFFKVGLRKNVYD
jgi:mRNA-degrading endonuclease RelE of RelBE toxin-antitoxin system